MKRKYRIAIKVAILVTINVTSGENATHIKPARLLAIIVAMLAALA